jgi:glycosyltransferase involved in cell wall biosynthesis
MILFIGPEQIPMTGQSVSFSETYRLCTRDKIKLHYSSRNSSIYKSIFQFFFQFIYIFFKNIHELKSVYITNSRTLFGFLRDALVIGFCSIFKKKIIIHVHGYDFISFRNQSKGNLKWFIDFIYNQVDTIIILHEKLRFQYEQYKSANIEIINNFHNISMTTEVFEAKIKKTRTNDKIKLLFFSNFMKEKGYIEAINATKYLVENGINVELNLVGGFVQSDADNNIAKDRLLKMIEDFDNICYHGKVVGEKKNKIFFESDILLFPSYYKVEAVPIVIIEAMASGCAIIATNHNLLPYLICDKSGLIVQKKSVKSIVDAIVTLRSDRNALSDKMKYNFQMAHTKMTEGIYKKLINQLIDKTLGT